MDSAKNSKRSVATDFYSDKPTGRIQEEFSRTVDYALGSYCLGDIEPR